MHHWVYCRAIFQNVAKKLGSWREENNTLCFWLLWCNELLYVHCGKVFPFSLFTTIYGNRAYLFFIRLDMYLVQIVCEYQPDRTAILHLYIPNILCISGFRWVPFKQLMWFVNQRSPYLSSMHTFTQNVTIKFQNSKDEFQRRNVVYVQQTRFSCKVGI